MDQKVSLDDLNKDPARVMWDPFGRTQFHKRDSVVARHRQIVAVPSWVIKYSAVGAAISILGLVLGLVFGYEALGLAFMVPTFVFSIILAFANYLNGENVEAEKRYLRLAERKDWAYRRVIEDKQHVGVPDSHDYLQVLVKPRLGQLIPMVPKAQYWGRSAKGIPFWMIVGDIDTFDKSRTRSTIVQSVPRDAGDKGNRGVTYTFIVAYDLDRDSGIRAQLLAEVPGLDSRRDLQTESIQFNRTYNISLLKSAEHVKCKQKLLQVLTPATQDVMLQLWDDYRAQFVFNGPTVFMGGYFSVMNTDDAVLEAHFDELLDACAEAALSFKLYAE